MDKRKWLEYASMPMPDWVAHPISSCASNPYFTHMIWCPGCLCAHGWTRVWTFNGDLVKPTISPSLLVRWSNENGRHVCHSFITDGMIRFLDDCTHQLKGQVVALEPF